MNQRSPLFRAARRGAQGPRAGIQRRRGEQAHVMLQGEGLLARREVLQARVNTAQSDLSALRAATPMPELAWMMPLADPEERDLLELEVEGGG